MKSDDWLPPDWDRQPECRTCGHGRYRHAGAKRPCAYCECRAYDGAPSAVDKGWPGEVGEQIGLGL